MKLTKYEKEIIINFNEGEQFASIYTHNSSLKRRLAKFSKQYPEICRPGKESREGSVSYIIDKFRLSICLLPPMSEERRIEVSEYAKKHGFRSNPPQQETV